MAKKYDLPAMPFYIGDWKKDPAVSVLTREEKMIWLEMLMLMWESQERGYLTVNGQPMTTEMLSVSLNLVNQNLSKTLTYFRTLGLFSERESDGAIYSRKIVKITELSKLRKNAGSKGGNPDLVNQNSTKSEDGGYPNAENENEYLNEDISSKDKKTEIFTYFHSKGYPDLEAEEFYNHYEAQGWVTGSGVPITNWRSKAENWHKEQRVRNLNLPANRKRKIKYEELMELCRGKTPDETKAQFAKYKFNQVEKVYEIAE